MTTTNDITTTAKEELLKQLRDRNQTIASSGDVVPYLESKIKDLELQVQQRDSIILNFCGYLAPVVELMAGILETEIDTPTEHSETEPGPEPNTQ